MIDLTTTIAEDAEDHDQDLTATVEATRGIVPGARTGAVRQARKGIVQNLTLIHAVDHAPGRVTGITAADHHADRAMLS
jgi:hypothetical protein